MILTNQRYLNKKVLLFRHRTANSLYLNTCYAFALLGAILKPLVNVRVLDNNGKYKTYTDREILDYIGSYKPDLIGVNINMFNVFYSYSLISEIIKNYPDIPVIVGGIHTNHRSVEILRQPVIVVKGEADITFPELIKTLDRTYFSNGRRFTDDIYDKLSNVKGIMFRNNKNEIIDTGPPDIVGDLDILPFVDYDAFNLNDFIKKHQDNVGVTNMIITQRGCPYSCIFCKSDDFGGVIREASPNYLVSFIENLYSKYNYKHIYFMDNNFTLNKKRIVEFCKLFIKSGLNKTVSLECQTNILCPFDDELLSWMLDANFLRIQFGIDRLTDYGIKNANIRMNNVSLMPKLNLLKQKGMKTFFSILLGMDFDTESSMHDEYEEIKKIGDYVQIISIGAVIPVPGTELYKRHPELKEWYLREDFNNGGIHYYDFALTGNSKVLELNLFNFPNKIVRYIMSIQLYGLKINMVNLFGKKGVIMFYVEKILILSSYHLASFSPRLELVIFSYVKIIRYSLLRLVYDLVYYENVNE